jgi:small subunit ribosomal protein S6
MSKFEAVLLFNSDLSIPLKEKEEKEFTENIETNEGKLISTEDWGLKDIAFKIDTSKKAFYKFYQIEINGSKIQNLKKILTQNEKILRHLFVKVEDHQELPTKMIGNNEEK